MTDHEDLILRLYHSTECMAHLPCADMELWNEHSNAVLKAATAIKELVAERDRLVWAVGEHVAKRKEYYDRAEKAESDLSAARAAIRALIAYERNLDFMPEDEHAPAIAAARAEKGGE